MEHYLRVAQVSKSQSPIPSPPPPALHISDTRKQKTKEIKIWIPDSEKQKSTQITNTASLLPALAMFPNGTFLGGRVTGQFISHIQLIF